MTECKILQDFSFSRDGVTALKATKDSDCDIPSALVEGLEAAGYLKSLGAVPENKMISGAPENKDPGTVDIPENWQGLPWKPNDTSALTIRALASNFTSDAIKTKDDAVLAIEMELERRIENANE